MTTSPRARQQRFAFEARNEERHRSEGTQVRVNPDPDVCPMQPLETYGAQAEDQQSLPPVWLQRLSLIIFVVFCVELGLVLAVLPWYAPLWNNNSLLANYPALRTVAHNNFVRGLISGLGLVDVWLGIWEAVHYRDRRPTCR